MNWLTAYDLLFCLDVREPTAGLQIRLSIKGILRLRHSPRGQAALDKEKGEKEKLND